MERQVTIGCVLRRQSIIDRLKEIFKGDLQEIEKFTDINQESLGGKSFSQVFEEGYETNTTLEKFLDSLSKTKMR